MLQSLINVSAERIQTREGEGISFSAHTTAAGKLVLGQFAATVVMDRKAADKLASALELAAEKLRRA